MCYYAESDTATNTQVLTNQNWAIALWYKKCLYKHVLALSGFYSWLNKADAESKSDECFCAWSWTLYIPVFFFVFFFIYSLSFTYSLVMTRCIQTDHITKAKISLSLPLCVFPFSHTCTGSEAAGSGRCHGLENWKSSDTAQAEGPPWGWMKSLFACNAFLATQH